MEEKDSEKEFENDTNSELNTGYGYEMDVLSDRIIQRSKRLSMKKAMIFQ